MTDANILNFFLSFAFLSMLYVLVSSIKLFSLLVSEMLYNYKLYTYFLAVLYFNRMLFGVGFVIYISYTIGIMFINFWDLSNRKSPSLSKTSTPKAETTSITSPEDLNHEFYFSVASNMLPALFTLILNKL